MICAIDYRHDVSLWMRVWQPITKKKTMSEKM